MAERNDEHKTAVVRFTCSEMQELIDTARKCQHPSKALSSAKSKLKQAERGLRGEGLNNQPAQVSPVDAI